MKKRLTFLLLFFCSTVLINMKHELKKTKQQHQYIKIAPIDTNVDVGDQGKIILGSEYLDILQVEPLHGYSFKELIEKQVKKDELFILAVVIGKKQNKQIYHRYYEGCGISKYFFLPQEPIYSSEKEINDAVNTYYTDIHPTQVETNVDDIKFPKYLYNRIDDANDQTFKKKFKDPYLQLPIDEIRYYSIKVPYDGKTIGKITEITFLGTDAGLSKKSKHKTLLLNLLFAHMFPKNRLDFEAKIAAKMNLGFYYYNFFKQYKFQRLFDTAIDYFSAVANQSRNKVAQALAHLELGNIYSEKKKYEKAIKYLKFAANQSYEKRAQIIAQLELGNIFYFIKNDPKTAQQYYLFAASQTIDTDSQNWAKDRLKEIAKLKKKRKKVVEGEEPQEMSQHKRRKKNK